MSKFFKSKIFHSILEWTICLSLSVLLGVGLNKFVIINAHIPSGCMEPTIMTGDDLFVNRLAYTFAEPKRFDIAVFKYPDDEKLLYIKRIIGLPGEKLQIKDGKVYINDSTVPLRDEFANCELIGDYGPYVIPQDCYFMLGDNRNNSVDSRFWNNKFVKKEKIVGKAIFGYAPKLKWVK